MMEHVRTLCLKMYSEIQFNRYLLRVFRQGVLPGTVPDEQECSLLLGVNNLVKTALSNV